MRERELPAERRYAVAVHKTRIGEDLEGIRRRLPVSDAGEPDIYREFRHADGEFNIGIGVVVVVIGVAHIRADDVSARILRRLTRPARELTVILALALVVDRVREIHRAVLRRRRGRGERFAVGIRLGEMELRDRVVRCGCDRPGEREIGRHALPGVVRRIAERERDGVCAGIGRVQGDHAPLTLENEHVVRVDDAHRVAVEIAEHDGELLARVRCAFGCERGHGERAFFDLEHCVIDRHAEIGVAVVPDAHPILARAGRDDRCVTCIRGFAVLNVLRIGVHDVFGIPVGKLELRQDGSVSVRPPLRHRDRERVFRRRDGKVPGRRLRFVAELIVVERVVRELNDDKVTSAPRHCERNIAALVHFRAFRPRYDGHARFVKPEKGIDILVLIRAETERLRLPGDVQRPLVDRIGKLKRLFPFAAAARKAVVRICDGDFDRIRPCLAGCGAVLRVALPAVGGAAVHDIILHLLIVIGVLEGDGRRDRAAVAVSAVRHFAVVTPPDLARDHGERTALGLDIVIVCRDAADRDRVCAPRRGARRTRRAAFAGSRINKLAIEHARSFALHKAIVGDTEADFAEICPVLYGDIVRFDREREFPDGEHAFFPARIGARESDGIILVAALCRDRISACVRRADCGHRDIEIVLPELRRSLRDDIGSPLPLAEDNFHARIIVHLIFDIHRDRSRRDGERTVGIVDCVVV